jgi:hypothetical protein
MDGASFDRLSRIVHRLRHQATRRQALRTLAVGGLAGLVTRLGTEDANAACTRPGRRCSGGRECCQGLTCRNGRCRAQRWRRGWRGLRKEDVPAGLVLLQRQRLRPVHRSRLPHLLSFQHLREGRGLLR